MPSAKRCLACSREGFFNGRQFTLEFWTYHAVAKSFASPFSKDSSFFGGEVFEAFLILFLEQVTAKTEFFKDYFTIFQHTYLTHTIKNDVNKLENAYKKLTIAKVITVKPDNMFLKEVV